MLQNPKKLTRLDRWIDALATRVGIFLMLGVTGLVCAGAGFHISSFVWQLERDHAIFQDREIRNGYVAMSDVQRLVLISQNAFAAGEMTPPLEDEFIHAADIIFVRIDNFERLLEQEDFLQSGYDSIAALKGVMAFADQAIARGFPDVEALLNDLLVASNLARENLVQFLDDMRREADRVLDVQSAAIRYQKYVVLVTLAVLALLVTATLFLLNREVRGRRARNEAEKKVAHMAYFDSLTELPNRVQFQTRLQQMIDNGVPVTLLITDLDGFKIINDTYGHSAGDAVLKAVGSQLNDLATRTNGFAARLGGDEFALVIPFENLNRVTAFCAKLLQLSAKHFDYQGETFKYGFSIGAATATQAAGTGTLTLNTFTRVTDFALYQAKQRGQGEYCIYNAEIEGKFEERKAMIEELPKAIRDKELEAYLQPKVDLPAGNIVGFEALVRWRRGDRLIPPVDFITIAEESGLVLDIDRHVLRVAAETVMTWNTDHDRALSVSVNLSTLHFASSKIVAYVAKVLVETGLPPELLTLEITETTEMRDWKTAQPVLIGLKALGVKISIDDFGTGYSSLAYLQATMADELKVDRSLIEKIETSSKACLLLSSVLDIARNLDLKVVVEGVETAGQAALLSEMGVDCVQGFHYSRPVPTAEALEMITKGLERLSYAS